MLLEFLMFVKSLITICSFRLSLYTLHARATLNTLVHTERPQAIILKSTPAATESAESRL